MIAIKVKAAYTGGFYD